MTVTDYETFEDRKVLLADAHSADEVRRLVRRCYGWWFTKFMVLGRGVSLRLLSVPAGGAF